MRIRFTRLLTALLPALLLAFLVAGCDKNKAPQPLSLDQIPAAMNQAFAKAPTERKELVERALSALQNKEFTKALMVVEGLCAVPDLTSEQRETASRALLTLNHELQAAAQRGDKSAAEFQRLRQTAR
jgi:hypothetical protein